MTWLVPRDARRAGVSLAVILVAAVGVFASLNVARTRPAPLANGHPSPQALAGAVLQAMTAGDLERLRAMALTEEEFRAHVWPHLPASRPERNVPFDFVWDMLQQNSDGYLRQSVSRVHDVPALLRVEFAGETSTYGDVAVHRDTELVVAAGEGEARIRLLGSMIEQNGAWKVFSYVVDD
jgi:hypothetical protein